MATVRRRAVCALALLVLLCCCCASFVCGATWSEPSSVPVQVACKREGKTVLWRFPGEGNWTPCTKGVRGGRFLECSALCHDVEEQYQDWECATACAGANEDAVAFTIKFQREEGKSGFCRDWTASIATETALSETPGICQLPSKAVLPEPPVAGNPLRGEEAQPPAAPAAPEAPAAGTPAADGAGGAEHPTDAAATVGSPDSSSPPPTDPAPEGGSGGPDAPRDWTTFITDAEMMLRKNADGGVVVRGNAAPLLLPLLLLGMWGAGALA
ncbi:mucin-like glycoprotein [Trypanosoma conorhini]|uniref:Mucin-like glycoprotein n=1 Tax=Trypanosoma conorhini TaxID=83891 RepID=A0A3R7JSK0_9TRYP|nr:mucin-like glycoprotein [Trypanosoma conorhini]RNE96151.1 mucin-like glycoprotein [Trypanosoma conorhini]